MARRIAWTEAALDDVEASAEFIARDSPHYAATLVREARDAARSLDRFAARGRVVSEIGDQAIRELFIGSFRLIYRIERKAVHILAFVHGARDLAALWSRRKQ